MPKQPFSLANLRDTVAALYGRQWQLALARDLNVQPRTIRGWFNGKPLPDLREKLAELCRLAAVDNPAMGKARRQTGKARAARTVGPEHSMRLACVPEPIPSVGVQTFDSGKSMTEIIGGCEMGTDADQAIKCRQRAERIRVIAERKLNPESRELMLRLSEDYERLADVMEEVGVLAPEPKAQ